MKVGIDVSSLIYGRGVSNYTSNLVAGLLARSDVDICIYGSTLRQRANLLRLISQLPNTKQAKKIIVQPYPPSLQKFLWQYGLNKVTAALPGIEVFHSWDWLQPPDKNLPLVSTIHDLAILKYPETAHPKVVSMHQASWKILKDRDAQIITPSHSTRKDVIELLDFDPKQVHVIYEALPFQTKLTTEKMSEEKYQVITQRMKLDKPYLLFVGTQEPRKNLERLIKAWKPLEKDYQLLIAGAEFEAKSHPPASAMQKALRAGKSENKNLKSENLRFLGRVTDDELAVLYGEAKAFVFPSLDEGFGLPILEAYYHGVPVVTSNIGAMPEVAGNAAELVDPKSVTDIRRGIEKVLTESKSEQQKRLQQMIIRLQLFNWDRVAEQTVEVYRKAIGS